jgi:hypothetical protein
VAAVPERAAEEVSDFKPTIHEERVVTSFEGLYDIDHGCIGYDINKRSIVPCWLAGHDWVHGALAWRQQRQANGSYYESSWGHSYDRGAFNFGMKFCRRCKQIECVHVMTEQFDYRIELGRHVYQTLRVGKCEICGIRMSLAGCTHYHAPERVTNLVREFSGKHGRQNLGSGFWCDFPVYLESVWERDGEDVARAIADEALRVGRVPESAQGFR